MTENAPERIWVGFNDDDDFPRGWGTPICGKEMFWETPEMSAPDDREGLVEFVRKDLAKPVVKPLEWVYSRAESEVGTYVIDSGLSSGVEGRWYAWAHDPDESDSFYIWQYGVRVGSEEAAKAAAQADYEQRILSALEDT